MLFIFLIFSGEEVDRVYILLEGDVQIESIDNHKYKKLQPGACFGGIDLNARQFLNLKAM